MLDETLRQFLHLFGFQVGPDYLALADLELRPLGQATDLYLASLGLLGLAGFADLELLFSVYEYIFDGFVLLAIEVPLLIDRCGILFYYGVIYDLGAR